jgi:EAL domain-containing protein (putative c-di-GMP-specific phosphodiesterase class I)/GGDEF domain-containing protein
MIAPPIPINDKDRVAELVRLNILDTPAELNFDAIAELAAKLFKAPIALISLVDSNRQWFKSKVGLEADKTLRTVSFCGHAICENDTFVVPDATRDPRFASNPLVTGAPFIRFYAGAQLLSSKGHALGTLCIIDTAPRPPLTADEDDLLRHLARFVMSQIEVRRTIGFRGPLSGLPNRLQLQEDLEILTDDPASDSRHVVIATDIMDPERHRDLVQTFGYAYSDEFTLSLSRILLADLPDPITLYQLLDHRFAFVLSNAEADHPEDWISRIAAKLDDPIICGNLPIKADLKFGMARYPKDTRCGATLLRAANSALHDAHEQKVAWCHYSATSDDACRRAFQLLSDLPAALTSADQLELHFQPKIDLATGACIGAEALLRWRYPTLGMIPPAEIVALAERTELMGRITEWVVNGALKQLAAWIKAGRQVLTLAVNISVSDLNNDSFTDWLAGLLTQYDVPANLLELEVTESALMADPMRAKRQLDRIRALGISIAIDDFGTGQSSLFYMKHIPANVGKIDQVFIHALTSDFNDRRIVNSMMDLAHDLGCRVVAEGIESSEVQSWLASHGCNEGQGFNISHPLEAAAFDSWLLEWQPVGADSVPAAEAIAS